MSVWMHVAAVFRIDGVKKDYRGGMHNGRSVIDWDEITGKAIYDGDWCSKDDYEQQRLKESWEAYRKHPNRFMPAGSEGSLQRLLWINPDAYCAARYTVTVFGDLRDYEDFDAIEKWFDGICEKCHIRQAVCNCTNGYETKTFEKSWS